MHRTDLSGLCYVISREYTICHIMRIYNIPSTVSMESFGVKGLVVLVCMMCTNCATAERTREEKKRRFRVAVATRPCESNQIGCGN